MINGHKKSDPIIDYPSLRENGFEHIDEWLLDCQKRDDTFAIKFYLKYIHTTILELIHKVDDNTASIIRRGYKLLEKWEG